MEKLLIGKYVTTHGLKGEIRIKSDYPRKEEIFKIGNTIIIDKPYTITSYRVHKGYDMVTLDGINKIEDIINLRGSNVYIDRDNYFKDEIIDEDLIKYHVVNKYFNLPVTNIYYLTKGKKLIEAESKLIPYELIKKIDNNKKEIIIEDIEGL